MTTTDLSRAIVTASRLEWRHRDKGEPCSLLIERKRANVEKPGVNCALVMSLALRLLPWLVVGTLAARDLWGGPSAYLPWLHVAVAIGTALLAAVASRAALARETGSAREAALSIGAALLAGALAVHAVATPGAFAGETRVVGVSGLTSIMFLAGGALGAMVLPMPLRLRSARRIAVAAGICVALAFGAAPLVPGLLQLAPPAVPVEMLGLLLPAAAALLAAGAFAGRWYGSGAGAGGALEAGCTLLGASLLMHFGPAWTAAFWLSRTFELLGAGLLAIGCSRAFAAPDEVPSEPLIELYRRPALRPDARPEWELDAAA